MRIAVTGAGGRLGRAIVKALDDAPFTGPAGATGWGRSAFDLDAPGSVGALLDDSGVELVIHAAAWTDVDGCALDPALAMRRNGEATGVLAGRGGSRGVDLLVISTNEVFDGARGGGAYGPGEVPAPANPYGASKLAGETAARAAYMVDGWPGAGVRGEGSPGGGSGDGGSRDGGSRDGGSQRTPGVLGIARTAWLFGPGAPDFPRKIAAAAGRAIGAGEALRVVSDEIGTPTYVADVADSIVELIGAGEIAGMHHLVNGGFGSRAEWARDVLERLGIEVEVEEVPLSTFPRPSRPPLWGVLAATPLPSGEPMRHWRQAMADYAPLLRRSVTMPA